ncbi:MAG: IS110 family transposase [Longimicrobiales bacterium]
MIAVDLAKHVFELAVATQSGRIAERKRLTRSQFERFWATRIPCRVVMEACATAHYWARYLIARRYDVVLLPPQYVKPYRRRNKTDRADCEAILEAYRCAGIHPVAVKSEDQQAIAALHRVRAQWMQSRTARINGMRGLLAEFGVSAPVGAKRFLKDLHPLLARVSAQLPERVRRTVTALWDEVRELEQRIEAIETELESIAADQPALQALLSIPGMGLLSATALFATVGDIHAFKSGRQLACWLGLTPREHSSGGHRRLGRISKQGDPYVRMLFVHGARSALNTARRLDHGGKPLSQLQAWALQRARSGHSNKATVALANKLVRIAWAVWYHDRRFNGNHVQRVAA